MTSTELADNYRGYAARLARTAFRRAPAHIDREDIVADGYVGLMKAARAYDPSKGVKFTTFATYYIIGTIQQGLRDQRWAPRNIYEKSQQLFRETDRLTVTLGRTPTDEEICEATGFTERQLSRVRMLMRQASVLSFDYQIGIDGEHPLTIADVTPNPDADVTDQTERRMLLEAIRKAVNELPTKQRQAMIMRFGQDLKYREIAAHLGVSEVYANKLVLMATEKLRTRLSCWVE